MHLTPTRNIIIRAVSWTRYWSSSCPIYQFYSLSCEIGHAGRIAGFRRVVNRTTLPTIAIHLCNGTPSSHAQRCVYSCIHTSIRFVHINIYLCALQVFTYLLTSVSFLHLTIFLPAPRNSIFREFELFKILLQVLTIRNTLHIIIGSRIRETFGITKVNSSRKIERYDEWLLEYGYDLT